MEETVVVWSLMLRSSLSQKNFMLWTQTKLQPQSWSLTLRLWCQIPRPAPSQISQRSREKTVLSDLSLTLLFSIWMYGFNLYPFCGITLCPYSLFRYLDEASLFSRPTYAAFLAVLDNYKRMTGQAENFSSQQLAEQDTFLRETMSNTKLGSELFAFLYSKGKRSMCNTSSWHKLSELSREFSLDVFLYLKGFMHPRQSLLRTWRWCGLVCTPATTTCWTLAALNTSLQVWTDFFQVFPNMFSLWFVRAPLVMSQDNNPKRSNKSTQNGWNEKNQSVTMNQWKSRLQPDWNNVVGPWNSWALRTPTSVNEVK